jgi:uncharacterized protein (DUF1501 family)
MSSPSRREFLLGCATAVSAVPAFARVERPHADRRCIFVWLTGGPSQLDTFDPKPDAPSDYRGPFRPIATRVPGLHVTELFPRLAARADNVAFVRSLHHDEAPIHETGQQLLQTGGLCRAGERPHIGATLGGPWSILPGPLGDTGVDVSHGQTAGPLGPDLAPHFDGGSDFVANCRLAVRRVEAGDRLVVVNQFATVYDGPSWDCHADGGRLDCTFNEYRATVAPMFDVGFANLLDDLADRGLLDTTLVVAVGEFGRTPRINPRGGRDHWPGVFTALFAGAGVRGGAVIGASDRFGAEPADCPVAPTEFVATIYHALGIHSGNPIRELFS